MSMVQPLNYPSLNVTQLTSLQGPMEFIKEAP